MMNTYANTAIEYSYILTGLGLRNTLTTKLFTIEQGDPLRATARSHEILNMALSDYSKRLTSTVIVEDSVYVAGLYREFKPWCWHMFDQHPELRHLKTYNSPISGTATFMAGDLILFSFVRTM